MNVVFLSFNRRPSLFDEDTVEMTVVECVRKNPFRPYGQKKEKSFYREKYTAKKKDYARGESSAATTAAANGLSSSCARVRSSQTPGTHFTRDYSSRYHNSPHT